MQPQQPPPLLLEGVSFHFEADGEETDDEFDVLAGGLGDDGPLSSSTLEILIEHFSSDGLDVGEDGPVFDDDYLQQQHTQQQHTQQFGSVEDGFDNARDAFGSSHHL